MRCPACGTESPDGAVYCPLCQRDLQGEGRRAFAEFRARHRSTFLDEERRNRRKSAALVASLWGMLAILGAAIATGVAAPDGDPIPLVLMGAGGGALLGATWSAFAQLRGDRLVLSVNGAVVDPLVARRLENVVAEMALAAGIRPPEIRVIESPALNAFATGVSDRATIAVTRGLLEGLDREELAGVIAHETAHIRNGDVRLSTEVAAIAGLVVLLSDLLWRGRHVTRFRLTRVRGRARGAAGAIWAFGLVFALLAPLFARGIQFAVSRRRELLADASAVALTRQPDGLLRALRKIGREGNVIPAASRATRHLFLVDPLRPLQLADTVFATHPPLSERIERLVAMGANPESASRETPAA